MKKLALAAIAAMSVGACATHGSGNGAARATPVVAGAQYCWHDRFDSIGSRLNCNWTPSKEMACASSDGAFSTVDGTSYHYPRTVTCANGKRLVELAPKA